MQRLSVFEPYPMRDTVQHFCEKHLDKIKLYMESVSQRLPPPAKCTIEGIYIFIINYINFSILSFLYIFFLFKNDVPKN